MKRIILVTVILMLAAPAFASVEVYCVNDVNEVTVHWDASGEDPCLVRAFALDITVSDGNILEVGDTMVLGVDANYWVYPGSIVIDGENVTDEGSPVGNWEVYPGTLGEDPNGMTVEMASLYAAEEPDPNHQDPPPNQGVLFKFYVEKSCTVTLEENTTRGGVVMENPYDKPTVNLTGCTVTIGWPYPACWDYLTFCHGDGNGDGTVNTVDWPAFRDSFYESYPDAAYNPCGDYNRDGTVNTVDWPDFRDNFYTDPPADCTPGDPHEIYKP